MSAQPLRALEVEIWLGGNSTGKLRGYLVQKSGDALSPGDIWTFSGHFLEWLLSKALVAPQTISTSNPKGELAFAANTYGTILITVVQQAQTRGALTGITWDFTTTHDSNGVAWASNVTNLKFSPGVTVLQVAEKGVELELGEFELTAGRVLRAYNPGTRGTDRTTGGTPLTFQHAINLREHARRESSRDGGTAALAKGGEGFYDWASSATALAELGFRAEVAVDAGQISTQTGVTAYAQAQLEIVRRGVAEYASGIELGAGSPRPILDYGIGDWGYAVTGTTRKRLRISQLDLSFERGRPATVNVVQNDLVTDALAALYRRLNAISSGDAVVGTSTATPGTDTMPPAAPTGLVLSSNTAYQLAGHTNTVAEVTVGWTPVTTNADTTAADDIASYRVRYAYLGPNQVGGLPSSTPAGFPLGYYEPFGSPTTATSLTWGEVEADSAVGVQVAAIDSSGNQGAWSARLDFTTAADDEAPPVSAAAVLGVWFRTFDITATGLGSAGEPMPSDFSHFQVWLGRAATYTPPASTTPVQFDPASTSPQHVADLFGAGTWNQTDIPVGIGYYACLVAVDRSGNAAARSAMAGPATAEQLVSQDLLDNIITKPKIADFAVGTAEAENLFAVNSKIGNLAVNSAKVEELQAGLITTGTMTATVTNSGIIQTAASGSRLRFDSTGIQLYNASNVVVGRWLTTDASILITGTYQSGLTGERINILPDGTQRFYPAAGVNYSQINNFGNDLMIRGILDANSRSGRINVNALGVGINFSAESEIPANLRSEMIATDRQVRTTAPLIVLELDGSLTPPSATNRRVEFRATDAAGAIVTNSLLYYTARSGDNLPALGSNNSGLLYDSKVCVTTGSSATFGAIAATSYDPPSSETVKDNIVDARAELDPRETIRNARSRAWTYIWEHWTTPAATEEDPDPAPVAAEAPVRFGPLAEDLPPVLRTDIPMPDGSGTVPGASLGSLIGVLWAFAGQVLDQRLVHAHADVPLPQTMPANTDVDITVRWADGPTQTPPAVVSTVPVGPNPIQVRSLTVRVLATTTTGVTVRLRSKRPLVGMDAEDRYVINALAVHTPPYVPEAAA